MSLLLYLLGVGVPLTPTPKENSRQRNRLHKAPPERLSGQTLYSCNGILDVFRDQSCLKIFDDKNSSEAELQNEDNPKSTNSHSHPHIGFFLERPIANPSEDSISTYYSEDMDLQTRRRRAKTPVFAIGQLETNSMIRASDRARNLAEEYQAILPSRSVTPYLNLVIPKPKSRKLRKSKCQLSLRDLVKEQSKRTDSIAYSDAETLVGSESPNSLPSPTKAEFDEKVKLPVVESFHDLPNLLDPVTAAFEDDIGLKICVDLLTNELATALFRQHPAEREDRASGLQILLMIEAYETVQQHVRQQLCDPDTTDEMIDHVKSVDKILTYWLKVLYSVYDHSREMKNEKNDVGDQFPLRDAPDQRYSLG